MLRCQRLNAFFIICCTIVTGLKPLQHTQLRMQRPDLMIDVGLNAIRSQISWKNWALIMGASLLVTHYIQYEAEQQLRKNKVRYDESSISLTMNLKKQP